MEPVTVVVIAKPGAPHLSVLKNLPPEARVLVGNSPDFLKSAMPQADVLAVGIAAREPFRSAFELAKRVRWVHAFSTGVDYVLTPELVASPVPLTNGRGVFAEALGEFALAAMLYFAKDLKRMLRNQQAGVWAQFEVEMLAGRTLGVIGYGSIGQAAARRAKAFGMRVIAVRRRAPAAGDDPSADKVYGPEGLREVLPQCDYVLLATPKTPETVGMIGEAELAVMKESAVIVNLGRGPAIVESALIAALTNRRIRGAALDVFDREPLPENHPFYKLDNVLLSPHCADHTAGWLETAAEMFVENFRRFSSGMPLLNIVDKQAGY